ncbi:hypothetical protein ANN_14461 [Periplaneta americana]|uniref:Reverse transcriptase domain-containing protein n=1 Tax=Periplaneta americana TaxID=6978 RepID=A0ABQ8SXK9_PERAM|nr:hypothetical protein ANN_14461 [Periplaneta americana]
MGLEVNPEKTKYMVMTRDQNIVRTGNIQIEDLSFEEVEKFKYLGATVTNINDTREEIKRKINMGNACYCSVGKLLSSSLLSKNLKVRIYKTVILPVLYGCETWTFTLREEQRLKVSENKVLRKIFEAKRNKIIREWRKLHNAELHALYSSPDIIRNIKSGSLRWAGHVARMGESRNAYRIYSRWLDHDITLPTENISCVSTPKKHTDIPSTSGKLGRGRPTKVFGELSERSKRRKAKETRENVSPEELSYATVMSLRSEGDEAAAKLLKEVTTTTPSRGKRIRDYWRKEKGNSGHSQYKQIWHQKEKSDESLFLTSLVPLRSVDTESGDVAWKNPRPSSTRFCRPIRLQWVHETMEIAQAEREYVENQIQDLQPFTLGNITVQFSLLLTMIDGKICNTLAKSSSMKCYICGAKISEKNNLEFLQQQSEDTSNFVFGLSILHAHIRRINEEATESLNKTVRRFRLDHTRKASRITSNSDLFHRLFLASDPLISNLRELPKKERTQLPLQVLQLLSTPEAPTARTREILILKTSDGGGVRYRYFFIVVVVVVAAIIIITRRRRTSHEIP